MCSVRGIGVAVNVRHVHLGPRVAAQRLLRPDAEALLLVDHEQPQVA